MKFKAKLLCVVSVVVVFGGLYAFIWGAKTNNSENLDQKANQKNSTSAVEKPNDIQVDHSEDEIFKYHPIEEWVGRKFVFAPAPKYYQENGYLGVSGGKGKDGRPTYEECASRIGTVVNVKKDVARERSLGENVWVSEVEIKMDDNGQVYTVRAADNCMGCMVPIEEGWAARAKFTGKTVWCKIGNLRTQEEGGGIPVKPLSPVQIIDVSLNRDGGAPFRLTLRTPAGETGFADVAFSATNVPPDWFNMASFKEHFLETDPKIMWPANILNAIEHKQIIIGMSGEQVRLSWGFPEKINTTVNASGRSEQWVYAEDKYLYFENGTLTAIQK
jgi:hypothetical protein